MNYLKNRILKSIMYSLTILVIFVFSCKKQETTFVESPDKSVRAVIDAGTALNYAVIFNNDTLINQSSIDISLKEFGALKNFEIIETSSQSVNQKWERVWGKRKIVTNNYNELEIKLSDKTNGILINLYVRAYDDGVGLRYGFPEQEKLSEIKLAQENTQFSFAVNSKVWMADYENFVTPQEHEFFNASLADIKPTQLIGMPLLLKSDNDTYAVITEANLTNWSGAFLKKASQENTMVTSLSLYPNDSSIVVIRNTPALSPWRVIMLANNPGELIESDIIQNLNEPVALEDVSWIEPGASAWDWWWSNSYAPSQDFEIGSNQQTMKYFIDFASEMGWEYQIVDWKWYGPPLGPDGGPYPDADITQSTDKIDIPELVEYAKKKNVKLIVWGHWKHLNDRLDEALALFEEWGVSGIKIDFMDRQDQEMVNFYHEVVKKAAARHLVVNFHGAYKPTGVSRTYPNMITREGVLGNEYTKWSDRITPEHNVTLPFTRGLLGEMDYTPGAFRNVTPESLSLRKSQKMALPWCKQPDVIN